MYTLDSITKSSKPIKVKLNKIKTLIRLFNTFHTFLSMNGHYKIYYPFMQSIENKNTLIKIQAKFEKSSWNEHKAAAIYS